MVGKLIVIGLVLFLLVGGAVYTVYDSDEEVEGVRVVNPATGEKWDSIGAYEFRNVNNHQVLNG